MAYKLINEYDKVRTITEIDLQLLGGIICISEKYWKLINYYLQFLIRHGYHLRVLKN